MSKTPSKSDSKTPERRYTGAPPVPHSSEERQKTALALPARLMERARTHGNSTLASTIQDAAEVYLLHTLPTSMRERLEGQVHALMEADNLTWKQVLLDAVVEGLELLSHKRKDKTK